MNEYLIIQETDIKNTHILIDSDSDYQELYKRINSDKIQDSSNKCMIVEVKYTFNPVNKK